MGSLDGSTIVHGDGFSAVKPTAAASRAFMASTRRYGGAGPLAKRTLGPLARHPVQSLDVEDWLEEMSVGTPDADLQSEGTPDLKRTDPRGQKTAGVTDASKALHPRAPAQQPAPPPKKGPSATLILGAVFVGVAVLALLKGK
jgi:hypothetical protein